MATVLVPILYPEGSSRMTLDSISAYYVLGKQNELTLNVLLH